MRICVLPAVSAAVVLCASSAQAAVVYSTGFEPPVHGLGSVHNVDGWVHGTQNGQGFAVTNLHAAGGTQSLRWTSGVGPGALQGGYTVGHDLGGYTATSGQPVSASIDVWIDPATQANRTFGVHFAREETAIYGRVMWGVSVAGDGRIYSGSTSGMPQVATAAAGTFAGRWLTMELTFDPSTGVRTARVSGFSDGYVFTNSDTNPTIVPVFLTLGADHRTGTTFHGTAYFDNVVVSVPEPGGTLAGVAAAGLLLRRRRRDAATGDR